MKHTRLHRREKYQSKERNRDSFHRSMIDLFEPWREEEQVFDHNDPMQHHRLLMKRIVAKKTTNQQFLRELFRRS